jgi:putative oxidoreductase
MNILRLLRDNQIVKSYFFIIDFGQKYLFSLLIFFIRIQIAKIFWYSGLAKIASWQSTIYLFKHEYNVPLLNPEIAAFLSTTVELSAPVLLAIGLMSRMAAIPMLFMTAIIEFTYLSLIDHQYWAILLGIIILHGPGFLSIDHLIRSNFEKTKQQDIE